MAKRESKGQQVKTFKTLEPDTDAQNKFKIVKVYFDAVKGEFNIYLPEHMTALLGDTFECASAKLLPHQHRLYSKTIDGVMEGHKVACFHYLQTARIAVRKKVLVFYISCNSAEHNGNRHKMPEISFCDTPALHVSFQVYWLVGDQLYEEHRDGTMKHYGATLDRMGSRHSAAGTQIEWTQEREDFFAAMTGALEGLIGKLIAFTDQLGKNPELAIATFAQSRLLAAPAAVE